MTLRPSPPPSAKEEVVQPRDKDALATERAEQYAPMPKGSLFMAGAAGAGLLWVADLSVSRFYAWKMTEHWGLTLLAVLAGFGGGLVLFLRLARANRRATMSERRMIEDEECGVSLNPDR